MKKLFSCFAVICLALNASAQYQVGNSDFETDWTDTNEPGNGWYSFVSGTGAMSTLGIPFSKGNTTKVDGRNGGSAVKLISSSIFGQNANGNLTTGRINLGSTKPADTSNYNFTDRGKEANNCMFSGRPDKMEFYAKFTRGGSNNNGRCHAIIHGDYNYKDPYETASNENTYKIAEATVYATPCTEWTRFDAEFSYTGVEATTSYLLATFTTNENPGGSKGDVFIIDDIKFIYYSQLKSLTVDGVSVPNFEKDTYDYTVDSYYTEGVTNVVAVDNTKAGVATVASSYNAETGKYTIVVTNQEGTESHTYTIQFKQKVYECDLLTLTYDGEELAFSADDATEAFIDGPFDKNKLAYTVSEDATAEVSFNEEAHILNVDVTAGDGKTANSYEIQFYYKGDVNKDGTVSIADVTALVNMILGKTEKNELADVNADGDVSIADVTALVNIILGKN